MDYPFVALKIRARVPHWQACNLFVTTRESQCNSNAPRHNADHSGEIK